MGFKKFLLKYRRPLIILAHLLLVSASYWLAFLLRFEFDIPSAFWKILLKTLPVIIVIKMLIFYYTGIFYGLWRYVSLGDLWLIFIGNTVSTFIFVLLMLLMHGFTGFPRSVFILDLVLSISLISGVRFFTRLFREKFKPSVVYRKYNTLIVGAGEAGILMLKECRSNPSTEMNVRGFIDDDPAKKHQVIYGVRVWGSRKDIPAIVHKLAIEEIILAIPSAKGEVIRDILSYCELPGVRLKTVPRLDKILSGELEIKPREVQPEDLLGRETVKIDEEEILEYLNKRRVLVTGAGGSIGQELCRQISNFYPTMILMLDINENDVYFLSVELKAKYPHIKFKTIIGDVKDIGLLKHIFTKFRPHIVFHSAAHKHVPLMQENPIASVKNNVLGSRNLIYAANHYRVERFVLISTDKAVNPINIMGMTKRIAEMILQAKAKNSKTKFMAVRFGNVIGSAGSVVPLFKRQIENGGPLTVTHPQAERYFMSIREAVALVLQAGAFGKGGEIFILDMGEQIKILDIAKNLIALSGLTVGKDIAIEFVGLRGGEKLSEELLLNIEKDRVTKNKKIYVTEPNHFDPVNLRHQLKELERYVNLMDEEKVVRKIKEILPLSI
jgi:FlaA1/EpsC-like NDP-sugar epimerase